MLGHEWLAVGFEQPVKTAWVSPTQLVVTSSELPAVQMNYSRVVKIECAWALRIDFV